MLRPDSSAVPPLAGPSEAVAQRQLHAVTRTRVSIRARSSGRHSRFQSRQTTWPSLSGRADLSRIRVPPGQMESRAVTHRQGNPRRQRSGQAGPHPIRTTVVVAGNVMVVLPIPVCAIPTPMNGANGPVSRTPALQKYRRNTVRPIGSAVTFLRARPFRFDIPCPACRGRGAKASTPADVPVSYLPEPENAIRGKNEPQEEKLKRAA